MKIIFRSHRANLFLVTLILAIAVAASASAQTDTTVKRQLNGSTRVHGEVGGEAHDAYVIYARKGQKLTVRLDWIGEGENRAEFSVSRSTNFYESTPVRFGRESYDGRRWTGTIPRSGNYYIYLVAHPSADYILKVTLN